MRLTEHRRKLLRKLSRADIASDTKMTKGNLADLEWLEAAGLVEKKYMEGETEWFLWGITDAGMGVL